MTVEIRALHAEEVDVFLDAVALGFGEDRTDPERSRAMFDALAPRDRALVGVEAGEIVATLATFPLDLTLPGGATVAMAGTTMATVLPTHRRQGVLTRLIRRHLDDAREREEPVAGLWASEAPIYGRFGFGAATEYHRARAVRPLQLAVPPSAGGVRLVDPDRVLAICPPVFDAVRSRRPGAFGRTEAWWRHRLIEEWAAREGSRRRWIVHEGADGVDGYAWYRQEPRWEEDGPRGKIRVGEVVATTAAAHAALWRFLTSIDLHPDVECWNVPLDDPLPELLVDRRALDLRRHDGLWLRPLDPARLLEARGYRDDARVDLAVVEPDGTRRSLRLEVAAGVGRCLAPPRESDLEVTAAALGRLLLGGGHVRALVAAGALRGPAESVTALGRLLAGEAAPWCQEVF